MKGFMGFPSDDIQVGVPASFFSELLPVIEDLVELKVTLFLLWDCCCIPAHVPPTAWRT